MAVFYSGEGSYTRLMTAYLKLLTGSWSCYEIVGSVKSLLMTWQEGTLSVQRCRKYNSDFKRNTVQLSVLCRGDERYFREIGLIAIFVAA